MQLKALPFCWKYRNCFLFSFRGWWGRAQISTGHRPVCLWVLSSYHFTDALPMNIHCCILAQIWDGEWQIFAFSLISPYPLAPWSLSAFFTQIEGIDQLGCLPPRALLFFLCFPMTMFLTQVLVTSDFGITFPGLVFQTCLSVSLLIAERCLNSLLKPST